MFRVEEGEKKTKDRSLRTLILQWYAGRNTWTRTRRSRQARTVHATALEPSARKTSRRKKGSAVSNAIRKIKLKKTMEGLPWWSSG